MVVSQCRRFQANLFNKARCQHCFRVKEAHSAEALENNRAARRVTNRGYLYIAPDNIDFSSLAHRNRRWQRRWFCLFDDGELTWALDQHPDTIPQGNIDMTKCEEVSWADVLTHQTNSIKIASSISTGEVGTEVVQWLKADSADEIRWWYEVLSMYPKQLTVHQTQTANRRATTQLDKKLPIFLETQSNRASGSASSSAANPTSSMSADIGGDTNTVRRRENSGPDRLSTAVILVKSPTPPNVDESLCDFRQGRSRIGNRPESARIIGGEANKSSKYSTSTSAPLTSTANNRHKRSLRPVSQDMSVPRGTNSLELPSTTSKYNKADTGDCSNNRRISEPFPLSKTDSLHGTPRSVKNRKVSRSSRADYEHLSGAYSGTPPLGSFEGTTELSPSAKKAQETDDDSLITTGRLVGLLGTYQAKHNTVSSCVGVESQGLGLRTRSTSDIAEVRNQENEAVGRLNLAVRTGAGEMALGWGRWHGLRTSNSDMALNNRNRPLVRSRNTGGATSLQASRAEVNVLPSPRRTKSWREKSSFKDLGRLLSLNMDTDSEITPGSGLDSSSSRNDSVDYNMHTLRKGWLMLRGRSDMDWTKYWVVLAGLSLSLYKDAWSEESGMNAVVEIDLGTCEAVHPTTLPKNYGIEIRGKTTRYVLSALTPGIRDSWIRAIHQNIFNPSPTSPAVGAVGSRGDGASMGSRGHGFSGKKKRIAYVAPESHHGTSSANVTSSEDEENQPASAAGGRTTSMLSDSREDILSASERSLDRCSDDDITTTSGGSTPHRSLSPAVNRRFPSRYSIGSKNYCACPTGNNSSVAHHCNGGGISQATRAKTELAKHQPDLIPVSIGDVSPFSRLVTTVSSNSEGLSNTNMGVDCTMRNHPNEREIVNRSTVEIQNNAEVDEPTFVDARDNQNREDISRGNSMEVSENFSTDRRRSVSPTCRRSPVSRVKERSLERQEQRRNNPTPAGSDEIEGGRRTEQRKSRRQQSRTENGTLVQSTESRATNSCSGPVDRFVPLNQENKTSIVQSDETDPALVMLLQGQVESLREELERTRERLNDKEGNPAINDLTVDGASRFDRTLERQPCAEPRDQDPRARSSSAGVSSPASSLPSPAGNSREPRIRRTSSGVEELQKLRDALVDAETDIHRKQSEIENLKLKLDISVVELSDTESALTQSLQDLQKEKQRFIEISEDWNRRVRLMEAQLRDTVGRLDRKERDIESRTGQLREMTQLQANHEEMVNQVAALHDRMREAERSGDSAVNKDDVISSLEEKVAESERKIRKLMDQVKSMELLSPSAIAGQPSGNDGDPGANRSSYEVQDRIPTPPRIPNITGTLQSQLLTPGSALRHSDNGSESDDHAGIDDPRPSIPDSISRDENKDALPLFGGATDQISPIREQLILLRRNASNALARLRLRFSSESVIPLTNSDRRHESMNIGAMIGELEYLVNWFDNAMVICSNNMRRATHPQTGQHHEDPGAAVGQLWAQVKARDDRLVELESAEIEYCRLIDGNSAKNKTVSHAEELESLRSSLEAQLRQLDRKWKDEQELRRKCQHDMEEMKSHSDQSLSIMERTHQKLFDELKFSHEAEMHRLNTAFADQLQEEKDATRQALDSLRKAHERDLERESLRIREALTQHSLDPGSGERFPHRSDLSPSQNYSAMLEEVRRELGQLSAAYSSKCLENSRLEEELSDAKSKLFDNSDLSADVLTELGQAKNRITQLENLVESKTSECHHLKSQLQHATCRPTQSLISPSSPSYDSQAALDPMPSREVANQSSKITQNQKAISLSKPKLSPKPAIKPIISKKNVFIAQSTGTTTSQLQDVSTVKDMSLVKNVQVNHGDLKRFSSASTKENQTMLLNSSFIDSKISNAPVTLLVHADRSHSLTELNRNQPTNPALSSTNSSPKTISGNCAPGVVPSSSCALPTQPVVSQNLIMRGNVTRNRFADLDTKLLANQRLITTTTDQLDSVSGFTERAIHKQNGDDFGADGSEEGSESLLRPAPRRRGPLIKGHGEGRINRRTDPRFLSTPIDLSQERLIRQGGSPSSPTPSRRGSLTSVDTELSAIIGLSVAQRRKIFEGGF